MKRFYKEAGVKPEGAGFAVVLDGRSIKTPAKKTLVVPTKAAADLLAEEWAAQEEEVKPDRMPMTSIVNTALDRVGVVFEETVDEVAGYGGTDLLCYRAESPVELVTKQAKTWQPVLDWAAERYDAPLDVAEGVMHKAQPEQSLANLRAAVAELTVLELTCFHPLVTISGSLILALATLEQHLDPQEAFDHGHLDEIFQREIWGEDQWAEKRRSDRWSDFSAAWRLLAALRGI